MAAKAKPQTLSRLLKTQEEDWRRHSRRPIPLQYRVMAIFTPHTALLFILIDNKTIFLLPIRVFFIPLHIKYLETR
ncbi:MAG: hypothetical protein ACTTGX_01990 [Candidatus Cryptobacteroides sp.]